MNSDLGYLLPGEFFGFQRFFLPSGQLFKRILRYRGAGSRQVFFGLHAPIPAPLVYGQLPNQLATPGLWFFHTVVVLPKSGQGLLDNILSLRRFSTQQKGESEKSAL